MRSRLLTLGLALCSCASMAQRTQTYNYNKSAFNGFQDMAVRNTAHSEQVRREVTQQFAGWNVATDKLTGNFRNIYGPAVSVPGNTLTDKAAYVLDHQLQALGVDKNQWIQTRATETPNAGFVSYRQQVNGREVVFANLQLRFTADGKLVQITQKAYGNNGQNLTPQITAASAAAASVSDIADAAFDSIVPGADWQWLPMPAAASGGYELRPVWLVVAKGERKDRVPAHLRVYVDAINGDVLYRTNEIKETVDRTVKGTVYKQNPLLPATDEPLSSLEAELDGTVLLTDTSGYYSSPFSNVPVVATMRLQGTWSKVMDDNLGGLTPVYQDTIQTSGGSFVYPIAAPYGERHVNAYYHTTRVHNFMKGFLPGFTGMDYQLPTNVDVAGDCNAFYDGFSINFLTATAGCYSFANCGDIIYHEYGHGISDRFYQDNGTWFQNGAMNEGNSDIWGISITGDPVLGKGSMVGGGIIRRYDQAPKVYPFDIIGEVHADGEIIAGAWWDVAQNTGSLETMTTLFSQTYYDLPNGPDGTEGDVYYDVLIAALMNDDNDGNLNNGSPHFGAIIRAFGRHGIYYLQDLNLKHIEIPNPPANVAIPITATITVSKPSMLGDIYIVYTKRQSNNWDTATMVNNGNQLYSASIPAQTGGSIIDYYFVVNDTLFSMNAKFPVNFNLGTGISSSIVNIPYQFGVGLSVAQSNDFEAGAVGWQIGNVAGDNATSGIWVYDVPVGSRIISGGDTTFVQTANDHTLNNGTGKCLVTGNATSIGQNVSAEDVDNGKTTVLSPVFDLSSMVTPLIEYYRWYSNDKGQNPSSTYWQVQLRNGSASVWQNVDRTNKSDASWRRKIFSVKQYTQAISAIQLKFIANDAGDGSLLEAAVDDFVIYEGDATTGIKNVDKTLAAIYPNPANEQVQITMPQGSKGLIGLYDIAGKLINSINVDQSTAKYTINTAAIAEGMYMLSIQANGMIQAKQLVVKH